jgi:O6-methylguanine-DNA--protein-cysteine methyltransferase
MWWSPCGQTAGYRMLAPRVGSPAAVRAVGAALAIEGAA